MEPSAACFEVRSTAEFGDHSVLDEVQIGEIGRDDAVLLIARGQPQNRASVVDSFQHEEPLDLEQPVESPLMESEEPWDPVMDGVTTEFCVVTWGFGSVVFTKGEFDQREFHMAVNSDASGLMLDLDVVPSRVLNAGSSGVISIASGQTHPVLEEVAAVWISGTRGMVRCVMIPEILDACSSGWDFLLALGCNMYLADEGLCGGQRKMSFSMTMVLEPSTMVWDPGGENKPRMFLRFVVVTHLHWRSMPSYRLHRLTSNATSVASLRGRKELAAGSFDTVPCLCIRPKLGHHVHQA